MPESTERIASGDPRADRMPPASPDSAAGVVSGSDPPLPLSANLLHRALEDAERLLRYAVDHGIPVDPVELRSLLVARAAARHGWTEEAAAGLLTAASALAGRLKPVSAESLRNTASYRAKSIGRRLLLPLTMGVLAALIVLYSTLAFLFSSFSTNIRNDLDTATPLAVKLVNQLGASPSPNMALCLNGVSPRPTHAVPNIDAPALPPADNRKEVIEDLQRFASAIRDMYGDALRMNRLYASLSISSAQSEYLFNPANPPTSAERTAMLELPPGLPDLTLAATERVCVYQRVRYYAQSTEESATILTGAFASSILPVLYALLGAGAYALRRLEVQLRSSTFIVEAQSPRFITAAIAGAVVGLFNFGQGVSVSPLAIAFLAGFAVDVFFTFLEGMIPASRRARDYAGTAKLSTAT